MNLMTGGNQPWHQLSSDRPRRTRHKHPHRHLILSRITYTQRQDDSPSCDTSGTCGGLPDPGRIVQAGQTMLSEPGPPPNHRRLRATHPLGDLHPDRPRLRRVGELPRTTIWAIAYDTTLWSDDVWVVDSTPVECGRSRQTAKRSDLAGWVQYGYCLTAVIWHNDKTGQATPRSLIAYDR
jgi:hypothetical protein